MIKFIHCVWMSFLFLFTVFFSAGGQTILIQQQDGSIHNEKISVVQNLHFQSNDLILLLRDGSSNAFALSSIKKIFFQPSSGVQENGIGDPLLYPNPATNILHIQGIPQVRDVLYIYRSDGLLVYQQVVDHSHSISVDLNDLTPGLYMVRIAGLTSKFIKR